MTSRQTAETIRKISSGRAVGFDPITDSWIKQKCNARVICYNLHLIMSGWIFAQPFVNRARMMLLSKEDTSTPPINRIRPIQMYSPLRKALESQIDVLDSRDMWGSVHPNQVGARPNTKMHQQTSRVLREMHSGNWAVAWFVDYTEAFNRIHQPLLLDELRRRYEARSVAQALRKWNKYTEDSRRLADLDPYNDAYFRRWIDSEPHLRPDLRQYLRDIFEGKRDTSILLPPQPP